MSHFTSISDYEDERPTTCEDHRASLTRPLDMRACLIQELVQTQTAFTSDMKQLEEAFSSVRIPILSEDRYAVLSNLSEVVEISSSLDRCWVQAMLKYATKDCHQVNIAKLTLPYKTRLESAFAVYSTNYNPKNITRNAATKELVDKGFQILLKSNPTLLNADSMLIKPVQRVFKYQQLFEKLRKETDSNHEDFEATCELNEFFCDLLRKINETKRWNEILGDVFKEHTRSRFASRLKPLGQFFRNLRPSKFTHTDPKLAQEKWKLENLQLMSKAFRDWIVKQFTLIDESLVSERSFLHTIQALCTLSGNLPLHSKIRTASRTGVVSVPDLSAHVTIMDATRSHFLLAVRPKLDHNVVTCLNNLIKILGDPELLLIELDKTEQRLMDAGVQREQCLARNQPTTVIDEQLATLKQTRDTIMENLLTELPQLTKAAEKVLFSAVSYGLALSERLMEHYATHMAMQMQKSRCSIMLTPDIRSQVLMDYAEDVQNLIWDKQKIRSPSTTSTSSTNSWATKPDGITPRQLDIPRNTFKQNAKHTSDNTTDLMKSLKTISSSHSISRAHSDVTRRSSNSYNTSTSLLASATTAPYPIDRTRSTVQFHPYQGMEATHRAIYAYEARGPHQVSIQSGQLAIMLQDHDAAGNAEWCRVQVLPDETIGFVPANYLKPIQPSAIQFHR